jgi:hypothetical protein
MSAFHITSPLWGGRQNDERSEVIFRAGGVYLPFPPTRIASLSDLPTRGR